MPTRRQHAAATSQATTRAGAGGSDSLLPVNIAQASSNIAPNTNGTGSSETIGGRLRKRRRTDSSPVVDSNSLPKRPNPRNNATLSKRGQAVSSSPSLISQQEPMVMGNELRPEELSIEHTEGDWNASTNRSSVHTHHSQENAAESPGAANATGKPGFDDMLPGRQTYHDRNPMAMVDTESYSRLGAGLHLKTQSLSILDNLATQILNTIAKSSYREIITTATTPDSEPGQAYATLKSLFDHTKKVYSNHEPFLNPFGIGLVESCQLDAIRKANMATFVSSVFGSQDVGFYHLNENFLDTFITEGSRLLKTQAQLFLDLKTQAYISAATNGNRSRKEILEDLFPSDLENRLLKRKSSAKQLTPSEVEFVQRACNRRKALLEEPETDEAIRALPTKYVWEDFLKDVSTYVTKNFYAIAGLSPQKTPSSSKVANTTTPDQGRKPQVSSAHAYQRNTLSSLLPDIPQTHPHQSEIQNRNTLSQTDSSSIPSYIPVGGSSHIAEQAAQAANFAMHEFESPQTHAMPQEASQYTQSRTTRSQPPKQHHMPEIRYHFEHELHPNVPAPPPPQYFQHIPYNPQQMQNQWQSQLHHSYGEQQVIPYPTQSAPTQVLYERAREAATAKVGPSSRRSGNPSQRRPWTTDEENSLMAGLDRVKGPHWSQILAMFGPGGTINEVLKDRNQVQLKDKARNLKLFFLKSGIEVPYYLQFVTGELKTRAPGQAAKNEARERATSDEDRAHIEAVNTLAAAHSQGTDTMIVDLEGSSFANGNVPTANMGSNVEHRNENAGNPVIDPAIESSKIGAKNVLSNHDAPTDGVGELIMSTNSRSGAQSQVSRGISSSDYLNGMNPQMPLAMQLHAASNSIAIPSSNVDPTLSG